MSRLILAALLLTCFASVSLADSPPALTSADALSFDATSLSAASYENVADAQRIRVRGLPLDGTAPDGVELDRFEIFAADAELVLMTDDGPQSLPRPALAMFRSRTDELARQVVLSVSPAGVYGLIRTPTQQFLLSTGPANSGLALSITDAATLDGPLPVDGPWCAAEGPEWEAPGAAGLPGIELGQNPSACRKLRLAVETDNEYLTSLFGGNVNSATAYVGTLFGAVGQIYTWDLSVTFEVSFLRLWSTPDPWDETSTSAQLYEFRDYWNLNQTSTERGLTHYLSGRPLGGGVAWLSVLCNPTYGYGLSANLGGSFPLPIQNNHGANWDLMVVSHEIGHNFAAPHTHNMSPPVDCCGGAYGGSCGGAQDCTGANMGTIMSYCHVCPGGMSNVRMEFHVRSIGEHMMPYISDNPCLIDLPIVITDQPDSRSLPSGASVSFSVVAQSPAQVSYQWRRNGTNIGNTAHRSGTATPTLTINPISAADGGSYDCVLMSVCEVLATNPATLTVLPPGGCPGARGDANCNGIRDFFDIDPMLLALFNAPAYAATYCGGNDCAVDADCSGIVDFFDIDPFLDCLFSGCANCP